jgi:autotransporter-associated beta strand protein
MGMLGANTAFSGVIAGAGFIQKDGGGSLALSGANTYSGGTTVNSGILQIGSGGTVGTLGTGGITNNATLAFNRADAIDDTSFGVISGSGILDKQGGGRLALNKAHTYSGPTTIEAGTLALTNSGAIANSSSISISSGALFDVSGTSGGSMTLANGKTIWGVGSVNGNFAVGSGATLSPGMNGIGTLTFSNLLTLAAGSSNIFEVSNSPLTNSVARIFGALTNGGTLIVTNIGAAPLTSGNSFKLFNAATYTGAFSKVILPSLSAGLGWNTNSLNSGGTLSVVVVNKPFIVSAAVSSDGFELAGTGGVANANYYLLGSTNLAAPLTNWTRLLTNQFDGNGNFNFTNPIGNDPQSFYFLQLP